MVTQRSKMDTLQLQKLVLKTIDKQEQENITAMTDTRANLSGHFRKKAKLQ